MLRRYGHEIIEFTDNSDGIRAQGITGLAIGGAVTAWNFSAARRIKRIVSDLRPDIMHVHNTFPLLSPAIFSAASSVPRVLSLHNYRIFCPAAIPMRDGKICVRCLDNGCALPSMQFGCYRGSRLATLPLALSVELHRKIGTWRHHVDAFIALSPFQRDIMASAGLPERKVFVKPNFFTGNRTCLPQERRENFALFVGRLSHEKGIRLLIDTWFLLGGSAPELRIIGDGPLLGEIRELCAQRDKHRKISLLGARDANFVHDQMSRALWVNVPSIWFEGFPMVIAEAFAHGTPIVASDIGALPTIVNHRSNGLVFPSGEVDGFRKVILELLSDRHLLRALSQGALKSFFSRYSESSNYRTLIDVYRAAQKIHEGCD